MVFSPAALESDAVEGWNFELGETVTLLWNGEAGVVVGRTEYIHRDARYLVEYTNSVGMRVSQWLHEDSIDHLTVQ